MAYSLASQTLDERGGQLVALTHFLPPVITKDNISASLTDNFPGVTVALPHPVECRNSNHQFQNLP